MREKGKCRVPFCLFETERRL